MTSLFSLTEFWVRRDDGRDLSFTLGISRGELLAATIQMQIQPRLLAAARATFAAGREVSFGDVAVDSIGMAVSDVRSGQVRRIVWRDLRAVEAGGMQIHLRLHGDSQLSRLTGGGSSIATRNVANAAVFVALVKEILAGRT